MSKFFAGQLCWIISAPAMPELIGRQCHILQVGGIRYKNLWLRPHDEATIEVQGYPEPVGAFLSSLKPVEDGDCDFYLETQEMEENLVDSLKAEMV